MDVVAGIVAPVAAGLPAGLIAGDGRLIWACCISLWLDSAL